MADNEYLLKLVALLDKNKSKKQVNSNIRELEKVVRNLRLTATLAKGESKKNINQTIKQIEGQLSKIKLQAKIDTKNLKVDMNKALNSLSFKDINALDIDSGKTKLKVQKVLAETKKVVQNNPISLNIDLKKNKLNNQLTTYLSKNTKIRESEVLLNEVDKLRDKISNIDDKDSLRDASDNFQLFKSEVSATGYATKSTSEKIKGLLSNVTKIGSTLGVASLAVSNFQKSLKTIRELDSTITEISKTSNMTKAQLTELGNESFDIASKYGRLSQDLLLGVQEMARSGYETASKEMAELSLLAQSAGDLSADVANAYIIASDNAYKLGGDIAALTDILDGQNAITNKNSVAMADMAEGMSKAGTVASSYNVAIEDLSAMIGTMESVTKSGGSEVGNAIKAILINLQNVTSDKMVDTLNAANASMTEFVNGTEKLRNPIDILRDLAKTFNQLDEDDPLRAEILTNVGQKYHAAKLGALLQNMDMFDKMLVDYSNGAGSALEEANKSANNLEGTFNKLSNSWDELVNSIVNKSTIKGGVSFLDTLLQSTTKLIEKFDVLPVAAAGITAFLTAKNKDYGITKIFNEDGKFDVQGSFMGIDISQIKYFSQAKKAIVEWNNEVKAGKIDINDFNSEVVKNNASLRNYLSTCSVDAPASLKGYKAHLQAAGEATNSLRLGTILLNTVLSFGLGVAIKGIITGISKLSSASNDIAEKAKQIGEAYKSTQSEISDYKDKIQELHKTINSSSSSIEEVTAARQSLMTIQGEMIEKYGSEKEVIDMVTDAVNNQADAFDRLSEKKYQESVNDFNKFDPWENIANFFSGYSDNMDRMVSEMEEPVILNLTSAANHNKEEYEKFEKIISQYGKIGTGKYGDGNGVDHFAIELSGGLEGVYDKLLKIQEAASDFDFGSSNFDKSLTSIINETKEKLDNYSDIYDNYILYEKILSKSGAKNGYDKSYENINNAMKKYTDAKLDGDKEKIRSAGEAYASILTEELSKISPDDEGVKNYLQNLYPEMQEIVGSWNLEYNLKENPENEKQLKDALSKFSGINEIKQFDSSNSNDSAKNEAYAYLEGYADKYNLTFDQLIDKAQELGFVQDENYNELVNKFGEDNIKKLAPDELEIAYKIENTGNMSFEDLQKEIEETKKKAEETIIVPFEEAWKSLNNTDEESFKNLKEDLLTLAKQGKLTESAFNKTTGAKTWLDQIGISAKEAIEKINSLKEVSSADQLSSMKSGISSISNILGEKKENLGDKETANTGIGIDTLGSMPEDIKSCTKAYENFCEVLGNGASTMADCQKAANKLATAYVNSNNFLARLTESNKDYYISVLDEMGVQNSEQIVLDALNKKKAEVVIQTIDFTNKTGEEIVKLLEEQGALDGTTKALELFALKKIYANGNGLNTTNDINQLIALVKSLGYSTEAIDAYNQARNNAFKPASSKQETHDNITDILNGKKSVTSLVKDKMDYTEQAKSNASSYIESLIKQMENTKVTTKVSPTADSSSSSSKSPSNSSSSTKESTQLIDWISRKLDVLQDKIDLTKAKFENLFTVKKQKSNLTTQISQTTKLLNAQQKAIAKYTKKADSIKLSKSLKEKVKSGDITGSISALIKEYGESTASKITEYQDYIDKIKDLKKSAQESKTAIRELREELNQLYVDRADGKLSMLDAQAETALNSKGEKSAEATNKVLQKKVKWTKQYYNYQIKNAKLEKDSAKVDELQAQKEKALLDIKIEKRQNLADEAEANYNLYQQYEANAVSVKDKNKYESQSLSYLKTQYNKLIKIAELEGDVTEQKRLQLEKQEKIAESYQKMYDNIKTEYENETGLNDAQIAKTQAQIATLEAAGKSATKEMYSDMMKISSETTEKLLKERTELEEAGKNFEYGSQEWYDWQNDLLSIDQQLESCTQQSIEFQKAINELDLKKFALMSAQLDATKSHLDFLVDMLSHKDLVSKEAGGFTDEGIATVSLRFYNIENMEKAVKNAQDTLKKLYEQHLSGTDGLNEEEFLAKREEQSDVIRDNIEAIADEKDAILDLVEDAIQVQIDAINELIEKKKKALQTEKDLYDYQRKIAKQTKNIASIQKQIAALSGDNSEEARARLQKLKVSLEEAQDELKDTEYDKWLSDQEDMLDSLADEMEDFWEGIMYDLRKDINNSMDKLMQVVTDNPEAVTRALDELGLGDALSVITTYNNDGTHTDNAIDYGGNSYNSTYDDNTGTNVNNAFNTGSADGANGAGSSEAQKSAEEIARFILNSMEKVSANTPMAGGDYINQYLNKEFGMALSGDNLKKLLEMLNVPENVTQLKAMATLVPSGVFDMLSDPMFANGGTHSEFLEAARQAHICRMQITGSLNKRKSLENQSMSYINKYTTGEYGNALNQYLANKDGKVYTSWADMKELAEILGVKVSGSKVTLDEATKIRDALKDAGYAEGGIVSAINKAVKENGDDGIATLKKGEAVLTPKQTEAIQNASERFVRVGSGLTPEQEEYIKQNIVFARTATNAMENMEKAVQAMEINNNKNIQTQEVNIGDVNIHMDGSGVTDPDSFCDAFRRSNKMQRVIQAATIEQIARPYSNKFAVWNN